MLRARSPHVKLVLLVSVSVPQNHSSYTQRTARVALAAGLEDVTDGLVVLLFTSTPPVAHQ